MHHCGAMPGFNHSMPPCAAIAARTGGLPIGGSLPTRRLPTGLNQIELVLSSTSSQ